MTEPRRHLFKIVFQNFLNTLKPKGNKGVFRGNDVNGNKYFEVSADPAHGKRYPRRWFVPPVDNQFDQEYIPPEWEAWLRNRRPEPPNEEELMRNEAVAAKTQQKVAELALKEPIMKNQKHIDMTEFPVYEGYESTAGEGYIKPKSK